MKVGVCSYSLSPRRRDHQHSGSGSAAVVREISLAGDLLKMPIARLLVGVLFLCVSALAPQTPRAETVASVAVFDPVLAERLGADERGMRSFVLVILKTGPTRMPDGEQRSAMFAGHFANMERLSDEGKLVLAGPFSVDPDGWRGLFVLAVEDLDEARRLTESDPVIVNGEMVAEYHRWYGSAAIMMVPEIHARLTPPQP